MVVQEVLDVPGNSFRVFNYLLILIVVIFVVVFIMNHNSILPQLSPAYDMEMKTYYNISSVLGLFGIIGLVSFILVKIYRKEY